MEHGELQDRRNEALLDYMTSPHFRVRGNVTARYLAVLAFLHRQHGQDFEAVLEMRGRQRLYFAKSREKIEAESVHTFPQRIPGSPYWALTNSNVRQKQAILARVLFAFRYPEQMSLGVVSVLHHGIKQRTRMVI